MQKLGREFFTRDTLAIAKEMLGKRIVRKDGKKIIAGKIVETEAYIGPQDRASHAYKGKRTKRNEAEYSIGGHIYIYLVYGMHWQMNISTGCAGVPECILVRAIEPAAEIVKNKNQKENSKIAKQKLKMIKNLANGPGKLCRYLKVDKSFYGVDVCQSEKIWLESGGIKVKKSEIISAPRVGIDYAGPYWAGRKWRFYLKNNPFVSGI